MNRSRKRARLRRLLRRALRVRKLRSPAVRTAVVTLDQLKNSRRAPLFARLPRMLRRDGRTATVLKGAFHYVEDGVAVVPAMTVSLRRWTIALAKSRAISRRRRRSGLKRR